MTTGRKNFYQRHIAPHLVSYTCASTVCCHQRAKIVPEAEGHVVEIGIGSGHNLPLYDPTKVTRIIGIDPDPVITGLAAARMKNAAVPVEILTESAEAMSLEAGVADTVVTTYAFCTIPDPTAAMAEVRRILKPSGRLLFCEHGRSENPGIAKWQDRINPWWRPIAGGCNLNRRFTETISVAGLILKRCETYVPRWTPAVVGFHYVGVARPSA